jgi:hypothetical protein
VNKNEMIESPHEKDFQRYSAEAIYEKLFGKHSKSDHFLLADEVGLGKTVITKQLIDRLCKKNPDKKIHVYYVCNNLTLSDQNRKRLVPDDLKKNNEKWEELFLVNVDRLSLLPKEEGGDEKKGLKIFSLTPQTSLRIDRMRGNRAEKELISNILSFNKNVDYKEFIHSFCRGSLKHPLQVYNCNEQMKEISKQLFKTNFPESNKDQGDLKKKEDSLQEILDRLYTDWYQKLTKKKKEMLQESIISNCATSDSSHVNTLVSFNEIFDHPHIKKWRSHIIKMIVCELSLFNFRVDISDQTDIINLIVLDEFQRFDDILAIKDNANSIASAMFKNSKVLIVSATPYRAYSEKPNQHYEEFKRVLKFLFEGFRDDKPDDHVKKTIFLLDKYSEDLSEYFEHDEDQKKILKNSILDKKYEIEESLKSVMVRTERYHYIKNKNKGIETYPIDMLTANISPLGKNEKKVFKRSLKEFFWLSSPRLLKHGADTQFYWKSGDKLLSFMDRKNYKYIDNIFKQGKNKLRPDCETFIKEYLLSESEIDDFKKRDYVLSMKNIEKMVPLKINNEKMQYLMDTFLSDEAAGKYIWIKPSFTYYRDDFFKIDSEKLRKVIIFSAWNFIPNYIASMVSYQHECALLKILKKIGSDRFKDINNLPYVNKIVLSKDQFRAVRIVYPSYFLLDQPLPFPDKNKSLEDFMKDVKNIIQQTLQVLAEEGHIKLSAAKISKALFSERILQLDYIWLTKRIITSGKPEQKAMTLIGKILPSQADEESTTESTSNNQSLFDTIEKLSTKGIPTIYESDIDELVKMMVGSPAVALARAMLKDRLSKTINDDCQNNLLYENEYGSLFYRELKNFFQNHELYITATLNEGNLVEKILQYCLQAHFASVCEEFIFMLSGEVGSISPNEQLKNIRKTLGEVFGLHSGRSLVRTYDLSQKDSNNEQYIEVGNKNISMNIALPFVENMSFSVDEKGENIERPLRTTTIRKTFNSPFFPFILVSTSTGQEGLDFHYYCKDIMHWNLPNSPIDLEQREGRVNRYNGLLIRQSVSKWAMDWLSNKKDERDKYSQIGRNIWEILFEIVSDNYEGEERFNRGLFPHWLFLTDSENKLRRHVPIQTMSYDKQRFNRLLENLAYYRLALGQARQDDFIYKVKSKVKSPQGLLDEELKDELNEFTINLAPMDAYHYTKDYVEKEILNKPDKINKLLKLAENRNINIKLADLKTKIHEIIDVIKKTQDELKKKDYLERLFYFVNPFDQIPDHFQHGLDDDYDVLCNGVDCIRNNAKEF